MILAISDRHAIDLWDLLEWLSLCGFLSVRRSDGGAYHVVFPSEEVRWFCLTFVRQCVRDFPFDLSAEAGAMKARLTES